MKQAVKVKIYKELFFVKDKDNNKWSIFLKDIKILDVPFIVNKDYLVDLARNIKRRLTEFNSDKKIFEKILELLKLKNNQEYKVKNGGIFIKKEDKLLSLIIFDDYTIHISEIIHNQTSQKEAIF
jgi:hypothetical protein